MADMSGVCGHTRGMRGMMVRMVDNSADVGMYEDARTNSFKYICGHSLNIKMFPE